MSNMYTMVKNIILVHFTEVNNLHKYSQMLNKIGTNPELDEIWGTIGLLLQQSKQSQDMLALNTRHKDFGQYDHKRLSSTEIEF